MSETCAAVLRWKPLKNKTPHFPNAQTAVRCGKPALPGRIVCADHSGKK